MSGEACNDHFGPGDIVDEANELVQRRIDEGIARIRSLPFPVGAPGECGYCGEESQRLVGGACAPCRDKRHLP